MGIFNPRVGIKQNENQYSGVWGPVGFISQSGTHATLFSTMAYLEGLYLGKSVSFGNGTVLDSADYLAYFGQDPEIKVIGMYLEGVKGGQNFLKTLPAVSAQKPVVVWKGGRTEAGGRAIASHTGSLAVSPTIWDAAIRQYGAIKVNSMEEMVDTLKALLYLPQVRGNQVAVTGGSGGQSVAIADVFAEAGLRLPSLSQESYNELSTFYSVIGGGYRNPIDTGNQNRMQMRRILEIIGHDANIDNVVLLSQARWAVAEDVKIHIDPLVEIREKTKKPVLAIVSYSTPNEMERAAEVTKRFQEKDIPTFPTIERGAKALKNALDYYRRHSNGST
jgi:acyl-CoA synthetase (NDP forming)